MDANNRIINPLHLYHINTIDFDVITDDMVTNEKEVKHLFWIPNPVLLHHLVSSLNNRKIETNIIDIGCGKTHFPSATHLLDFNDTVSSPSCIRFKLDLDFDLFPYEKHYFNYAYCRHTLEDIQIPQHAFHEIIRVSKEGYIETPSPLIEILQGIDDEPKVHCGYIHHRYVVWSEKSTNTLYFLPKYPIVEYLQLHPDFKKRCIYLANHYPIYWNNYYTWDAVHPPNIVVYRNDINFKIYADYGNLILNGILSSIEYTNDFVSRL